MAKKPATPAPKVEDDEDETQGIDVEDGAEDGDDLVIDIESVEDDAGFEVLPRGTYDCEVANVEFGYSQASGNPMWTVTLEVRNEEYEGRKLFTHLVWAGKGLPRTKTAVKQIFADVIPDMNAIKPRELAESGELVGVMCRAKVNIRPYEGEKRNNVQQLLAPRADD